MKITSLFVIAFFALVSFSPDKKPFCACCAESGQYDEFSTTISKENLEVLKSLKFDGNADLYEDDAGWENVKGLKSIEQGYGENDWETNPHYFSVTSSCDGKIWKLNFKTTDGKTGTFQIPVPAKMECFKADLHDNPDKRIVTLYKEWRFKGTVLSGTGFLQGGMTKPVNYFLVLQGKGNNCENAEDYKNWRLQITGPKAFYIFMGQLKN